MEQIIQIQNINKQELKSLMEEIINDKFLSLDQKNRSETITVEQASIKLNVSKQSVWNYIKRGYLPAKKIGHKYIIKSSDVENALREVKSLKYRRDV